MTQDEGFKHITVTAAEDEDVVIHAGLSVNAVSNGLSCGASNSEPIEKHESVMGTESLSGEAVDSAGHQAKARRSKRELEGFRETTLEDLEPTPMPFTQKVVIVAAIVCIIGALVYYFVFMR